MSDPYLNCGHCGDQCACRATREELDRYRGALLEVQRLLWTDDPDGQMVGRIAKAVEVALGPSMGIPPQVEKSDGDFLPPNPFQSH